MATTQTDRLIIRPPTERDRARFVELFTDPKFMVFAPTHDVESAHERFDQMLAFANMVPYAKQPIVERSTGVIVGYTGVFVVAFEGLNRLEWGWRLSSDARGFGYATEATSALLRVADAHTDGEMLCIIDVENAPSRRVADKVGFAQWRRYSWPDNPLAPTDLLTRTIGAGGPALTVPS